MLTASGNSENGVLKAKLSGIMNENVDFDKLFGAEFRALELNCKGINRINSLGVKLWRNYFHKLRGTKIKVRFFELSPELVHQLNHLGDFVHKDDVESICAPYYCRSCATVTMRTFELATLGDLGQMDLQPVPCQNCQDPAEFDEIPEEFFFFLGESLKRRI